MVDFFHQQQQKIDDMLKRFRNLPQSPYLIIMFETETETHFANYHNDYTWRAKLLCNYFVLLSTITNTEPFTSIQQLDGNRICKTCAALAEYKYYTANK